MQLIGLLDCNNFFVSCERLFRPDLHNRPVAVLSGNDGCIVARSNEVKALGIPMGVPRFKVVDELKAAEVILLSSNFTLYRDISQRVMRTLGTLVETYEVYSIDEAFFALDVPDVAAAAQVAREIQTTIEQQTGIPVSIGVAKTKTIAKQASERVKKRRGDGVLLGQSWQVLQATVPLSDIWGIGSRLSARFTAHGLHTVADLLATERLVIAQQFGVGGCRMYDELHEQVVWPVGSRADTMQKSIMSTRSFAKATTEQTVVADALAYHVNQAALELRRLGQSCQYLQVIARASRHGDWALRLGSAEAILPLPTSDTRVLLKEALALLATFYDCEVPYKKAGVVLGGFNDASTEQLDLFGTTATQAQDTKVMQTIDALNARYGQHTITIGQQKKRALWKPAAEQLSPKYTTQWSDIATVRA